MWYILIVIFLLIKILVNFLILNCLMVLFNFYKVIKLFFNRIGEYL